MTKIALFGAGGKMGMRLGQNLKSSRFTVAPVEVSDAGKQRLKDELGWTGQDADQALNGADIVVLAVPDTAIGKVAHGIIDKLKPGTMIIILDAAAPFAGHLPERKDITYFVTHPCHPPIFNDETDMKAKLDRFGGVAAKQAIVCALMQGPESDYAHGEEVAKTWNRALPKPYAPRFSTSCAKPWMKSCAAACRKKQREIF
jgi:prephenate dehydrogenase